MDNKEYSCKAVAGMRLDAALSALEEGLSRSYGAKLIEEGCVLVNGENKKGNYKLKSNDIIACSFPDAQSYEALPEDIPLDIIYQDKDIAIINKPKGMVVHPAAGHYTGTLVNAIMYHIKDLSGIGGVERPGIVHRLDKDTSGLIAVAKNDKAHENLSKQLEGKNMNRRYLAVCKGNFREDNFIVEKNIDRSKRDRKKMAVCPDNEGRYAKTEFFVLSQNKGYALLECKLFTGRTHQIRVHLSHINHAIVGDEVYGGKDKTGYIGQALHAYRLELVHPSTNELMAFKAEPPQEFNNLLKKLGLERP